MGCYRRLISDAFRLYNWKTSPAEKCVSRNSYSSTSDPMRSGIFSQPIFRKPYVQNFVNTNKMKSRVVAKRFYCADFSEEVLEFKEVLEWYRNPRTLAILGVNVVVFGLPLYHWSLETVPFTKRGSFVVLPGFLDKMLGVLHFKLSPYRKGEILGSDHPESIRVDKIGQTIIRALRKEGEDDENAGRLNDVKWEFIVADDPKKVGTLSFSGGKIVVNRWLLDVLKTDAEIATVIGSEVGRVVARHHAENVTTLLWVAILCTMPRLFHRLPPVPLEFVYTAKFFSGCWGYDHYLTFCFWDSLEREADYIGLLLCARAGYDPRVAPEVYVKLGEHSHSRWSEMDASNLAHAKERAQRLSEPKVMEEALSKLALNDKEKEKEGQLNFF